MRFILEHIGLLHAVHIGTVRDAGHKILERLAEQFASTTPRVQDAYSRPIDAAAPVRYLDVQRRTVTNNKQTTLR